MFDHTITFRYKDPEAAKVVLNIRDLEHPIPMEKGADGIWSATTQPLPPAIYNYYFDVGGQWRLDHVLEELAGRGVPEPARRQHLAALDSA